MPRDRSQSRGRYGEPDSKAAAAVGQHDDRNTQPGEKRRDRPDQQAISG
jgi:hypothetical protein